jgi:hypothetical protein
MKRRFLTLAIASMFIISCGKSHSRKTRTIAPVGPKKATPKTGVKCQISDKATLEQNEVLRGALIDGINQNNRNLADKIYLSSKLYRSFNSELWETECHNDLNYKEAMLGVAGKNFFQNLNTLKEELKIIITKKANKKVFRKKGKAIQIATEEVLNPLTLSSAHLKNPCDDNQLCLSDDNNAAAKLIAIAATMHLNEFSEDTLESSIDTLTQNYAKFAKNALENEITNSNLTDLESQTVILDDTLVIESLLKARVNILLMIALKELKDGSNISLEDEVQTQALLSNKSDLSTLKSANRFMEAQTNTQNKINKLLSRVVDLIDFLKEKNVEVTINSTLEKIITSTELENIDNDNHRILVENIKELQFRITREGDLTTDPVKKDNVIKKVIKQIKDALTPDPGKKSERKLKRAQEKADRKLKRAQKKTDRKTKKDLSKEQKKILKIKEKKEKKEQKEEKKKAKKTEKDNKKKAKEEKKAAKVQKKLDKKEVKLQKKKDKYDSKVDKKIRKGKDGASTITTYTQKSNGKIKVKTKTIK